MTWRADPAKGVPSGAIEVEGSEVEGKQGFAGAGLTGEDGDEAVGEPAGPGPVNGGNESVEAGPVGNTGLGDLGRGTTGGEGAVEHGAGFLEKAAVFYVGGHGNSIVYGTDVRV